MTTSEKAAHTPGPWQVAEHRPHSNRDHQGCGAKVFSKALRFGDLISLAYVQGRFDDSEVQGNARLIAAAPEMLEALEMLLDRTANPVTDHAFYTLEDARRKGREAIRKAKGEK